MERIEAIILAGGLGTRLRDVIGADTPKCMAPVAGHPFLHYLLLYAAAQGVGRVVLSLGHKSEVVLDWLRKQNYPLQIDFVIEAEPLGTGGGIALAMQQCTAPDVFVLNGDTLFLADLRQLHERHRQKGVEATLALKPMRNFDRYGTVQTNQAGVITSFEEKAPRAAGKINGGVYLINRRRFAERGLPQKFSFEKDYLERYVEEECFSGCESDAYFIDIGVPQDYEQATHDFQSIFAAA